MISRSFAKFYSEIPPFFLAQKKKSEVYFVKGLYLKLEGWRAKFYTLGLSYQYIKTPASEVSHIPTPFFKKQHV